MLGQKNLRGRSSVIKTKTKMETDLTHDIVIGESEETDWFQVAVARGDEINDVRVSSLCFSILLSYFQK